jgi:hypothetical protein
LRVEALLLLRPMFLPEQVEFFFSPKPTQMGS